MPGFARSYIESSITYNGSDILLDEVQLESSVTCNGFDSLLDEPTSCGSATDDTIVKFLERWTSERLLVRSDGYMVDIDILQGKVVGLFFMSLTKATDKQAMIQCILDIASAYNELSKSKKGQFEIVWIAKVDNHSQFWKYLKMMPWLAIPFTDSVARNSMWKLAGIEGQEDEEIFLFNHEGKLYRKNAVELFRTYGADCYPFTDTRIKEIADEDHDVVRNIDLKKLLGNARRDFVVKNDRGQVPISELENKVVGIYFCNADYAMEFYFTEILLKVYRQLKRIGNQFEVVMVHTGGWCLKKLKKHGNADLKNIPWLLLPREDSTSNRLVRIFDPESSIHNCLVIVGQRGSFLNKSGYSTIVCYGIEAYPFSRLSVVETEKKRIEVSVKSLFTCRYVIQKSGDKVVKKRISCLSGKTIILLFNDFRSSHFRKEGELVPRLIKWYDEIKEKHVNFEVILVAAGYDKGSFDEYYGQMPWLAFPHDNTRLDDVSSELAITRSTLAVVGPNRQLLSMLAEFHFYEKGSKAYPFSGKDVLLDVSRRLSQRGFWQNY